MNHLKAVLLSHNETEKKARESRITAGASTEAELRYPERNWNLQVLSTARLPASEQGAESGADAALYSFLSYYTSTFTMTRNE